MNQRGNIALYVGLAIVGVVLVLGAGVGIRYYNQKKATTNLPTEQSETTSQSKPDINSESLVESDIDLIYPNGGEVLSFAKPIIVKYKVSEAFKKKTAISSGPEIYILNTSHNLIFIGNNTDPNANEFLWNQLDVTGKYFPTGQYKILLIYRPGSERGCDACGPAEDTLDGGRYEKGHIVWECVPAETESGLFCPPTVIPFASDVSNSFFSIK